MHKTIALQPGSSRLIHPSTYPHKMSPSGEAGHPQNSPRHSKDHRCDNLIWENIIGRGKPQILSPLGALYINARMGCHLCSLLFGSLKTYEPPGGFIPLTDKCGCVTDPTTAFIVGCEDSFIQIQVGCKWSGGDGTWLCCKCRRSLTTVCTPLSLFSPKFVRSLA